MSSNDRIPDLMKLGEIQTDMAQVVTTDIIEPSVVSDSFARFTLDRRVGFLHSNSKIALSVVPLTNAKAYFPLNIGVGSLIQRAVLKIGQRTISETQDFAHLHAYSSLFITNENNKEREQYLSQRAIAHKNVNGDMTNLLYADRVGIDNGVETNFTGASQGVFLHKFQEIDATDADTIKQSPVYSIYLSDLFGMLKSFQLPAYMLDEPIFVELTFTPPLTSIADGVTNQSQRCCTNLTGTEAVSYAIDQNELKMIYDSISYDGEVMEKYREQNKSISFSFKEYTLAKRTGVQTDFANLVFNVGGNGRLVSKCIIGLEANANFVSRSLINGYGSFAPVNGEEATLNLLYNDRYEFSHDRSNNALLFSTTQQSEGAVPMVTRGEYSREAGALTITTHGFEGNIQNTGLSGRFFWNSIRPNRAERVNSRGMDLTYKNPNLTAGTYTLRVWLELLKVCELVDGKMTSRFA